MKTLNDLNIDISNDSQTEAVPTNQNNPIKYPKGRVLTFIDDDGLATIMDVHPENPAIPSVTGFWTSEDGTGIVEIIRNKYPDINFRIGFAIITGWVQSEKYGYLNLDKIKKLQTAGHEIYSHTIDHVDANEQYDDNNHIPVSQEYLNAQYNFSQQWLIYNGCPTKSKILVYPGGLNPKNPTCERFEETINIARKYYDYAVNTNLEDSFYPKQSDAKWTLRRINCDELQLNEIEKIIENAADKNGWFISMTHAYSEAHDKESMIEKQNKIIALIEYCIDPKNNITILPFSEAVEYYSYSHF